jgi:drug/metabolite transporter (DMT)-like permease
MLNSLTPLFTIVLGVLFFGVKTRWINAVGIGIGFLGAAGLAVSGDKDEISANLTYGLLIVAATFCYGLSVNIIRKYLSGVNAITATVWALCLTGPLATAYLLSTNFLTQLKTNEATLPAVGYTAILGILSTALSVIVFNILIRNTSALFASSVTYIIPIVAMFIGIFNNETIVWQHFLFVAVILTGVWLVNKK